MSTRSLKPEAAVRNDTGMPAPLIPYLRQPQRFLRRWHAAYKALLTKEDVRDLYRISDLKGLEQLIEILPPKGGYPVSVNSIR
jgi:hypothetical protein